MTGSEPDWIRDGLPRTKVIAKRERKRRRGIKINSRTGRAELCQKDEETPWQKKRGGGFKRADEARSREWAETGRTGAADEHRVSIGYTITGLLRDHLGGYRLPVTSRSPSI